MSLAFTIGNKASYGPALAEAAEAGRQVKKIGPRPTEDPPYQGGCVWFTFDAANEYIARTKDSIGYDAAVYELELPGTADECVSPPDEHGMRNLLVDAIVVRRVHEYGDFDPDIPRDWEVWYCDDDGYALVPPDSTQAKVVNQVKTLLGTFRASYNEAKEKMHDLCAEHNASLNPEFTPTDTGHPAWVPCDDCDDYVCTIHNMHAADCACPALEEWVPLSPYETGGPTTETQP